MQGSSKILTYISCASTRVQPGLSQAGTVPPLLILVATRRWVFLGSPPDQKKHETQGLPGATTRVSMLQENTKFLGLETNLRGKDLEVAYCPVAWKCVRCAGCTSHQGMQQLLCLAHAHRYYGGLSSSQFQELKEEAARRSKENTD